jgi:transcriptional regulator with XRE-family HTH domain
MRAYSITARPATAQPQPVRGGAVRDPIDRAINAHVAERLKYLRLSKGATQTELGNMLDMTFQQVAKYERGLSKIGPDKLWRFAHYFGVDITYFFKNLDLGADLTTLLVRRDEPAGDRRVRLELAAAVQEVQAPQLLRSLLGMVRAVTE